MGLGPLLLWLRQLGMSPRYCSRADWGWARVAEGAMIGAWALLPWCANWSRAFAA